MNNLRCCVFSDAHVHNFSEFGEWLECGKTSRANEIIDAIESVYLYARKKEIKYVLFCGDMFHIRGKIPVELFNDIFDMLAFYSERGITTIGIPGNHDYSTKSENSNALESFNEIRKVIILDNEYIDLDEGFRIHGHKAENIDKAIEDVTDNSVLLLHTQITGSLTSSGYVFKDKVDSKLFKKFKTVFVGDVHKYQDIGKNVIVPGSLIQHSFSDVGCKKYFLDVVITNNGIKRVKKINTKRPMFFEISEDDKIENDDHNYYRVIASKRLTKDEIDNIKTKLKNSSIIYDIKHTTNNRRIPSNIKRLNDNKELVKYYIYNVLKPNVNKKKLVKVANKFIKD